MKTDAAKSPPRDNELLTFRDRASTVTNELITLAGWEQIVPEKSSTSGPKGASPSN